MPVAFDGITVAVHPSNTWVESLTVEDLRRLWRHEAEGRSSAGRSCARAIPDREVHLFGAGVDSGTFDYFTGVDHRCAARQSRRLHVERGRQHPRAGRGGDPNALGYFGFAYYEAHHEYVRAVAIRADADADAVLPTRDTIRSGAYRPLARPVFVYVNAQSLDRDDVRRFVDYYTTHVTELANDVGYVPLDARVQDAVRARLAARRTGSLFAGDAAQAGTVTLAARLGWSRPVASAGRGISSRRLIERALWACAAVSVLVTVGIVGVLAWEAAAFFREVSPVAFLTGRTWTPLFYNQQFGVLPLVAGTVLVIGDRDARRGAGRTRERAVPE